MRALESWPVGASMVGGAGRYIAGLSKAPAATEASAFCSANAGRTIKLSNGFYEAAGSPFKFSEYYYKKLWNTGRGAPFLQAEEVLGTASSITPDRMAGFYRYFNGTLEMVYNPTTQEVWHLMPAR